METSLDWSRWEVLAFSALALAVGALTLRSALQGRTAWAWQGHASPTLPLSLGWGAGYLAFILLSMAINAWLWMPMAILGAVFLLLHHGMDRGAFWKLVPVYVLPASLQSLRWVVLMVLPLYALNDGLIQLWRWMEWHLTVQPAVEMLQQAPTVWHTVGTVALASLLAPVAEEIAFRGVLYPLFKHHFGQGIALILQAVLFGALHAHLPTVIPLVLFGILLAWSYEASGSLWSPIILHGLFNLTSCMALLFLM